MISYCSKVVILILAVFVITSYARYRPSTQHHFRHAEELNNGILDEEEKHLALLHSQRVSEAGSCDVPKQQVIHVSDHFPGKYYLPHCTLLHRCGKHAGCCGVASLKCVAAKKEKVTLYFYSVKFSDGGDLVERQIEKLVFTNHTKCACVSVEHFTKHDL